MLAFPGFIRAQGWVTVLPANRAIDWSHNGATIVNRTTQCGVTLAAYSGTAATINTALTNCTPGQYVQLGSGTFTLSSSIVTTTSNVTLRGMGPTQTFIVFTATSSNCNGVGATSLCVWNGDSSAFNYSSGNITNWTAGYAPGTTALTVASGSGILPGMNGILTQNDDPSDPGNIYVCQTSGVTGACSQQGGSGIAKAGAAQSQNVQVVSVVGNTINITPGIYAPNWTSAKSPTFWYSSNLPVTGFGIENLSLDYSNMTAKENGIQFANAYNCWVKNVRSINSVASGGATHKHVDTWMGNHITVRDSYFYGASPTSEGYGVDWGPGSANNLAENNIFQHLPTGMINETSCCNVFSYNYSVDNYYNNGAPNWQQAGEFHHGAGDNLILWEGNESVSGFDADDIHGTAFFLTHFRDYLAGHDPTTTAPTTPKNQATFAYFPFANARYNAILASVLGGNLLPGASAAYHQYYQNTPLSNTDCIGSSGSSAMSVFVFGFSDQGGYGFNPTCEGAAFTINNDNLVASSQIRWGNYAACVADAACNTVRFQSSEAATAAPVYPGLNLPSMTFPASFYLNAKPSWWGSMPWPAVGPDVTGGNIPLIGGHGYWNPAANCYLNVLHGLMDGSTGVLNFDASACYTSTPPPPTSTIDWTNVHQTIDGFGAFSGFAPSLSSAQMNFFYTTSGIGLDMMRIEFYPDYTDCTDHQAGCISVGSGATIATADLANAQAGIARGDLIWLAEWSPPGTMKSNGSFDTGGSMIGNPTNYAALASIEASITTLLTGTYGIPIYGISLQNEPDYTAAYPSCTWTATQIHDYIPYLSSALSTAGYGSTKIMVAEASAWGTALNATAMSDASVAPHIGVLAAHAYSGSFVQLSWSNFTTQRVWETEVSDFNAYDGSMTSGLAYGAMIDTFLTTVQSNAWHYWRLSCQGGPTDNECLTDSSGNYPQRTYVLGQYSKFIRPGYSRIDATHAPQSGVTVSAYQNASSNTIAIVATNSTGAAVNQGFTISNAPTFATVTPYITSPSLSLAAQSPVSISGNSFTYTLPAQSVTTFSGVASGGSAPVITSSLSAYCYITNVGCSYTTTATNSPTSYSASGLPPGLNLNTSSGVISGTPTAIGAYSVGLGATNSFGTGTATLSFTIGYFVQAAGGYAGSATLSVTAGHSLYGFAFCGANPCTFSFTSTNESSSWSIPIMGTLTGDGDQIGHSCVQAALTSSDTLTVTGSGTVHAVQLYEMAGLSCTRDTTTPTGGYVTTDGIQTTPISGASITTTTANDGLFFYAGSSAGNVGSPDTWTPGGSMTNLTCMTNGVGYNPSCVGTGNFFLQAVGTVTLVTAGATTPSINSTLAQSFEYGTICVAYKPSGSPPPSSYLTGVSLNVIGP